MASLESARGNPVKLYDFAAAPELPLKLGHWLWVGLLLIIPLLLIVPWQQTVSGTGRVVAFSPTEREQDVQAPVGGRIVKWHVVEGSPVKAGEPIVELADIDPDYVRRIEERLNADRDRIEFANERFESYQAQASAYEEARAMNVKALRMKVKMAEQQVAVAKEKARVAETARSTAQANLVRVAHLESKGIASTRQKELAELDAAKTEAEYNLTKAEVSEAEANRLAAEAEVVRADAEGGAKVSTARAEAQKASAEKAYARGDVAKLEVEQSRQSAQTVVAPVDGTIVQIDGNLGGGVVKAGQHLARLIPDTNSRVVELRVDGNDAPLISKGRKVRIQFEGWPALQFVGWPSAAVGSFGGIVRFIDPAAADVDGRVRVLVEPDPADLPWPEPAFLRQQVRAKAWFLLDEVTIGWELWRRINGFPPTFYKAPPEARSYGADTAADKATDKQADESKEQGK